MNNLPSELYQIAYDELSLAKISETGFVMLDNLANARPDWYEYWPIRNFLLNHTLKENVWYGFFSPRFQEKTGLNAAGVREAITRAEGIRSDLDVILFSPQPDMGAFFLNVFEQGELFHPGLLATSRAVLDCIGVKAPIESMVMDSRTIVFSNYFVARARFWKVWLHLTEAIFAIAEDPTHPLYSTLTAATHYRGQAHQKVFLIERIASLILTLQTAWKAASSDTFNFAWSSFAAFNARPELAYQSDALKIAYRECGHPHYLQAFEAIRKRIGDYPQQNA